MSQQLVVIDGHQYLETIDDATGKVIALEGRDPAPMSVQRAILGKAQALIPAFKAGLATPLQQQQATAIILALLINLSDV